MRTRLTTLADLSERDIGAWRDLSARALEPNPFAEPDFVLSAAGRLGAGGEALLTVEDGSDLTAALPVQAARWRGWRMPVLMSWRHSYSFLGTPLIGAEAPVATLGRVLDDGLPQARAGMLALDPSDGTAASRTPSRPRWRSEGAPRRPIAPTSARRSCAARTGATSTGCAPTIAASCVVCAGGSSASSGHPSRRATRPATPEPAAPERAV